jgi:hypothetical protein
MGMTIPSQSQKDGLISFANPILFISLRATSKNPGGPHEPKTGDPARVAFFDLPPTGLQSELPGM